MSINIKTLSTCFWKPASGQTIGEKASQTIYKKMDNDELKSIII